MSIKLFEHNKIAYVSASDMLLKCKKAAVIHPTGTGKSFIGFKLCEDNSDKCICWLSPSEYIFKTQIENIKKADPDFSTDNIVFITYAKLMLMDEGEIEDIAPDYIILDEFHRCGALEWGKGVERLLDMYSNVPILGLSATAVRYLDNQRNMADELFDGNVASEITLGEAIVRGILNPPKYVLSVFKYQNNLNKYELRVKKTKNEVTRDTAQRYLESLRRALEKADDIDLIFQKHMTDRNGKYIVFCANKEHMDEMIEKSSEWFNKIDASPHIYSFYSEQASSNEEFEQFKKDESNHLKLLYCIDALNEGIHVEDISGVILLRPTVSPIIYKQQIGRALSTGGRNAVIFDIVLNIENLFSIDAIEEEMQIATTYYRSLNENSLIINEHFKIVDEVRDCLELFEKLNDCLSASWEHMFLEAQKYYSKNGNLNVPKRYISENGYTLGLWIETQRRVYSGKANGILTNEQIMKLESIEMCWDSKQDASWQKFYSAAKKYYEEHGDLLVSVSDEKLYGVKLGRWIANLRNYRKSGIKTSYLTPEKIRMLDNIGMIWDVPDYIWEQNYHAAVEYYREHGNLNVPNKYVTKDGMRLGAWIYSLRGAMKGSSKKPKPTPEQIERLNKLDMIWDSVHDIAWEKAYCEAALYYKEHGNLNIPVSYITDSGLYLGKWIRRQNCMGKLSNERIEKLKAIGMTWDISDPWEEKYRLVKAYFDKTGSSTIPNDYVIDGIWIGRWLSKQKAKLAGNNKNELPLTKEQTEKLTAIGIIPSGQRNELLWENQYNDAKKYFEEHGNLNVPKEYVGSTGKYLGRWLIAQRKKYREGMLSDNKITKLENIDFVFDTKPIITAI